MPGDNIVKQLPDPIRALIEDHEKILRRLELLETGTYDFDEGGNSETLEMVSQLLQFLDTDVRHHISLEEEALLPVLERRIGKGGGPIAVVLSQHEELWAEVSELQQMVAALDLDGAVQPFQEVSQIAHYIAQLLGSHIEQEDMMLFPLARDMLTQPEIAEVTRKWRPR